MTHTLLEQGISAALSGRRDEARALITQVVEADERNEQAWLWLAGLVPDPEDMHTCLENVLDLNPDNVKAREGLAWVEQRYGPRPGTHAESAIAAAPAEPQSKEAVTTLLAAHPRVALPPTSPAAPQPAPTAPAPVAIPEPADPCPYCGVATAPDDKHCPKCHENLMVRAPGHEKRSKALTALGRLWGLNGVLSILGACLTILLYFLLRRSGGIGGINMAMLVMAGAKPQNMIGQALGNLLIGLIYLALARGLLQRKRWAWIIVTGFQTLGLLAMVCVVLSFSVLARLLNVSVAGASRALSIGTMTLIIPMVVMLIWTFAVVMLSFISYGNVFVPMERLRTTVDPVSPPTHYQKGLAYRARGMWYMAAREWAAAVAGAPRELNYLHALGLAYIQLKRPDDARVALDRALEVAPDNQQIKDSRALVERMKR